MARECPNSDCAISKTEQFLAVLKDPNANKNAKARALRFVIHFVGGLHQPLHHEANSDHVRNIDAGSRIRESWLGMPMGTPLACMAFARGSRCRSTPSRRRTLGCPMARWRLEWKIAVANEPAECILLWLRMPKWKSWFTPYRFFATSGELCGKP